MTNHILLVEDELSIAQPLTFLLQREGFSVTHAADGNTALEQFQRGNFDLVLLDLMLPGVYGTEVCRQMRILSNTPIVMLTAKDSEIDVVVGLELGADDYITKPYSTRELLARIRAVLRRAEAPATNSAAAPQTIEIAGIKLDPERHTVTVNGAEVNMPLREFELLEMLMQNAGRVLTRSQLLDRIWGQNYYGDSKTLDVHIKRIRSKIEAQPSQPQLLQTVRGVGYRFT
ncbi:response regulator transcription factor [Canibacter oris]|uniref:Sensory transduction protein RegX3 n=1 Tax=Canibacter oris TaxID=1365628 RepID=A0A840DMH1_9MICO|nr:two-component system response regulator RegX3 [Canibacter oris]